MLLLVQRPAILRNTRCRVSGSQQNNTRKATNADIDVIRRRLLEEKMNPLGLKPENFTVVEDREGVIAFAQLEQLGQKGKQPSSYEFRSLIVAPEHRGKGIGSALLQQMMSDCPHDCYLTTLSRSMPFYEKAGFRKLELAELPMFLWFEFAAGTVVARLAVNDQLVAMYRPRLGGPVMN